MDLITYVIGFVVCYFGFGFSWWMSLLIALVAPIVFGLVMLLIGIQIGGISSLIEKIKERRRKPYPETTRGVYSDGGSLSTEGPMTYETTKVPITQAQPTLSMLAELEKERKRQSNSFGIWSLVLGIIGIFWWPAVCGIIAVVLGVVQFRRRITKRSVAGFTLGVVDIVLGLLYYLLGLSSFVF